MPEEGLHNGTLQGVQKGTYRGLNGGLLKGTFRGSGGANFETETLLWLNQLTTKPSAWYIMNVDRLIYQLKACNIWYQLDRFWVFATEQQQHARVSLINPIANGTWPTNITEVNSPT